MTPRSSIVSWKIFILLHALSVSRDVYCDAQLLSAYEQAYGPWNVKLTKNFQRRWHLETLDEENVTRQKRSRKNKEDGDLQLLFPEVTTRQRIIEKEADGEEISTKNGEKETQTQPRKNGQIRTTSTKSVRSASCILNLEKNGKFALSLAEDDDQKNKLENKMHHEPLYNSPSMDHDETTKSRECRGEWFLTPNPYCITDRHFDTLLLVSEPRMRRIERAGMIEKATVELRCKIWGRYGAGAVREKIGLGHGRIKGRMTHGTIVIVKEQILDDGGKKTLPRREVVGTFQGNTIVDVDSTRKLDQSHDDEDELPEDNDADEDSDWGLYDNFDEDDVIRTID